MNPTHDRRRGYTRGISHNAGETNPNAKLTRGDVLEIRRRRSHIPRGNNCRRGDPNTLQALAREFGVSPSQIAKVCRGEQWRAK